MKNIELEYGGYIYGAYKSNQEIEFEFEMKEDDNGHIYKSDECSDWGNFRAAVAEYEAEERAYHLYGDQL